MVSEFNGLSSPAYENGILHSKGKMLVKIQLGVICAHIVDCCRSGHILPYKELFNASLISKMLSMYSRLLFPILPIGETIHEVLKMPSDSNISITTW